MASQPDESESDERNPITSIVEKFIINDKSLLKFSKLLMEEMDFGLGTSGKSSLKMIPSYVSAIPTGNEIGNFLALDLGGTHLRVLLVNLDGKKADFKYKIFKIKPDVMNGSGEHLFDQIALYLAQFLTENNLNNEKLPLGFTFSFPLEQQGLNCGRLLSWTKGFTCPGVVGKDVVRMLQDAIAKRQDVNVDVVAVCNDTVGMLMSLGYEDTKCFIGVIVGTGTNACYLEKLMNCPKLAKLMKSKDDQMIINMEWGAFGENGKLNKYLNKYDKVVDTASINPGKQM